MAQTTLPSAGTDTITLSQSLARFAAEATYDALPDEVRASVRQRLLDTLGIALAATNLDSSQGVLDHLVAQGGRPDAQVIGLANRLPAAQAAFANGVLAHSLDYDDTHLPSILHPSATVVPAALAAAEAADATGAQLVAAIAVGLEVCVRVGMAGYDREARNSLYFDRGQHATSMCGALGGAVAAGLLLGGTESQIADSLGVAASMASGIIEANRTGGTVKRIHCGWAAHAAVNAAELVRAGISGPPTVFEGRFGFFQCFLDGNYSPDEITDGLGVDWAAPGIHFKPYPANHFTHTAIDAGLQLRERGVNPEDIASIELGVAGPTVRTIGEPIEVKRTPQTGYQAQFSGPYVLAAALLGGGGLGLGLEDFTDELAREPRRRALMEKVSVVAKERCAGIYPEEFPAVVRVRFTDGREEIIEVLENRGGPGRPLSDAEVSEKFRDNAGRRLASDRVESLAAVILGLGEATPVREVMGLVAG
ncbi:MmgE/PrpD family protein [Egicoccus sp. AB-alg2]|uniref:MmgE/PrpD family protein n=1 Tax=Egicoccus sp. AB-alg2 TaxID=3242693 RepID=UPI00359E254E